MRRKRVYVVSRSDSLNWFIAEHVDELLHSIRLELPAAVKAGATLHISSQLLSVEQLKSQSQFDGF